MKSTPIEECNGKALRGSLFHMSEQYLLLFWTDGSVTELYSEGDEDDSMIAQTSRYQEIVFQGYDLHGLGEAGLDPVVVEGIRQSIAAKQAAADAESKKTRRDTYERLKKEFDP